MSLNFGLSLENHYAQLPEDFYARMPAEKVGGMTIVQEALARGSLPVTV